MQASICLSAGVVGVVQSGLSWVLRTRRVERAAENGERRDGGNSKSPHVTSTPPDRLRRQRRVAPRHQACCPSRRRHGAHPRQHLLHLDTRCWHDFDSADENGLLVPWPSAQPGRGGKRNERPAPAVAPAPASRASKAGRDRDRAPVPARPLVERIVAGSKMGMLRLVVETGEQVVHIGHQAISAARYPACVDGNEEVVTVDLHAVAGIAGRAILAPVAPTMNCWSPSSAAWSASMLSVTSNRDRAAFLPRHAHVRRIRRAVTWVSGAARSPVRPAAAGGIRRRPRRQGAGFVESGELCLHGRLSLRLAASVTVTPIAAA